MFMHNYGSWGMGWGGGLLMALVSIAFVALVIWGVVRLTKHDGCCATTTTTKQSPIDIAKERYAKGEITKEQFEQIKKDLS
jgi:putative membrane protein